MWTVMVVCCFLCGWIAELRGRSIKAWVWLGAVFGPPALLLVASSHLGQNDDHQVAIARRSGSVHARQVMHVVSCHAAGEVGDVIVGGVAPPPGDTLWAQASWIASDKTLRNFLLNEPRGGVFRHVNLLVPPKDPRAQLGFIIMEPA